MVGERLIGCLLEYSTLILYFQLLQQDGIAFAKVKKNKIINTKALLRKSGMSQMSTESTHVRCTIQHGIKLRPSEDEKLIDSINCVRLHQVTKAFFSILGENIIPTLYAVAVVVWFVCVPKTSHISSSPSALQPEFQWEGGTLHSLAPV